MRTLTVLAVLATLSLNACNCALFGGSGAENFASLSEVPRKGEIPLQKNAGTLKVTLALTEEEKTQGLSGTTSEQFAEDQGMLFFYTDGGPRRFWMPDTYFDLDIFYLDFNLKVLDVVRDVPHHPGREEPPAIPYVRTVMSVHVLEIKASSALAKSIQIGDQLKWKGPGFESIRKVYY